MAEGKKSSPVAGPAVTGSPDQRKLKAAARRRQVAALIALGWENKEIAKEIGCTVRTVKADVNWLFVQHGIRDGIKRVKLAVLLFTLEREREQKT